MTLTFDLWPWEPNPCRKYSCKFWLNSLQQFTSYRLSSSKDFNGRRCLTRTFDPITLKNISSSPKFTKYLCNFGSTLFTCWQGIEFITFSWSSLRDHDIETAFSSAHSHDENVAIPLKSLHELHVEQLLRDNSRRDGKRTDGRTDGRPEIIMLSHRRWECKSFSAQLEHTSM